MMQSADPRKSDDAPQGGRLDSPRDGRIPPQRHVRSIRVIIRDVLTDQSKQMPLAEDNDVIRATPAARYQPIAPRNRSATASEARS